MDETTAAIKQAVSIVDVIGGYVRLEPIGANFRGLCPFHDDHKPSMIVDIKYQNYRCWACGAKGDVFRFLQDLERITFVEAKERLAERAGIPLSKGHSGRSDPRQLLYRVLDWAQQEFQKCLMDEGVGATARQYLRERGLAEETVGRHGVGYAPDGFEWLIHRGRKAGFLPETLLQAGLVREGRRETPYDVFRGRVMFPIRDDRKRVLGFGGRILPHLSNDETPKYLNTPTTPVYNKSEVLYGIDVAAAANRGPAPATQLTGSRGSGRVLVVMEGYTDCLMAYQHGLHTAVATCGTALTPRHVTRLRTYADAVVLMFDGDAAGQKAAREATSLFLSSELDLRLCVLPDGLDPCDFLRRDGLASLNQHIASAPDAIEFQIHQYLRASNGASLEVKRRALDEVLGSLAKVPTLSSQSHRLKFDMAVRRVMEASGVEESRLRARIEELRGGGSTTRFQPAEARTEAAPPSPPLGWEREITQWLSLHPGRAHELLDLGVLAHLQHPSCRKLAEAARLLYEDLGADATSLDLRERLAETDVEDFYFELIEHSPVGESSENWLGQLKANLEKKNMQAQAVAAKKSAAADENEILNVLKQFVKNQAP